MYFKCVTLLRKDHPEVSLSEGMPSCGREINFGSSGYSAFYKSARGQLLFFHPGPALTLALMIGWKALNFYPVLHTVLILCCDVDLIQMFIWYHCRTS